MRVLMAKAASSGPVVKTSPMLKTAKLARVVILYDSVHFTGEAGISGQECGHAVSESDDVTAGLAWREAKVVGGELGAQRIADFVSGGSIAVRGGNDGDLNAGLSGGYSEGPFGPIAQSAHTDLSGRSVHLHGISLFGPDAGQPVQQRR